MKRLNWAASLMVLAVVAAGCAHKEKMNAVEGGIDWPYDLLGTEEVHINTNPWSPVNWGWDLREIFTLGFADTSYPVRLQKALIKKAKKYGDVNQIIHVTYWPAPSNGKFPKGKIYARGEMVRYKRFPAEEPSAQPQTQG